MGSIGFVYHRPVCVCVRKHVIGGGKQMRMLDISLIQACVNRELLS